MSTQEGYKDDMALYAKQIRDYPIVINGINKVDENLNRIEYTVKGKRSTVLYNPNEIPNPHIAVMRDINKVVTK